MMGIRKKRFQIICFAAALLFCLSWAVPGAAESGDLRPESSDVRTNGSATGADSVHTIRMVIWDYDVTLYDRMLVEAFEKSHPDIRVEVVSYSTLYYNSSLDSLLDSGEKIDIIVVNQLSQMYQVTSRDAALPLDEFFGEDPPDFECYPELGVLRDEEGRLLGLPYRRDKFLLYYNRDLFERAGIKEPQGITWPEFADTAEALQKTLSPGQYSVFVLQLPDRLSDNYGDGLTDWRTVSPEEIRRRLSFYLDLERRGLCLPYAKGESISASQQLFELGGTGMFVQGTWYLNVLKNDGDRGRLSFSWGAAAKPCHDPEAVLAAGGEPTMMTPVCIHRNSTEKEAAYEFLRFMTGREGAEILADALIVPAYLDGGIRQRLSENLRKYGIDPDAVLDGYGPSEKPTGVRENEMRSDFYNQFGRALYGVLTPGEAVEAMLRIREEGR